MKQKSIHNFLYLILSFCVIALSLIANIVASMAQEEIFTLKSTDNISFLKNTNSKIDSGDEIFSLSGKVGPVYISTQTSFKDQDLISIYEVKDGDTIESIANIYNINKNTIIWANDLQNKKIQIGQMLIIMPLDGVKYKIKKGDTIESIAKNHKADAGDLYSYNNINSNQDLVAGSEIFIPGGIMETSNKVVNKNSNSSNNKSQAGYFIRPVIGGIKTQGIHGKNAIDIGLVIGTSIRAAASGTVIAAKSSGYNGGYGKMVIIKHNNGTQTLYAHMNSVSVTDGEYVEQGQNLGTSGNTGRSTGPHLHFEVRGGVNPF